jgi:hypothetical protein
MLEPKPVEWGDLVLPTAVELDLQNLIRLTDARQAEKTCDLASTKVRDGDVTLMWIAPCLHPGPT